LEKRVLRNLLKEEGFRNDFADLQEVCPSGDLLSSFRDYFQYWCEGADLSFVTQQGLASLAEERWKSFLLLSLQFDTVLLQFAMQQLINLCYYRA